MIRTGDGCYRIYDPSTPTVRLAIHVTFDETLFPRPFVTEDAEQLEDDLLEILTPDTQQRRAEMAGVRDLPRAVGDPPTVGDPDTRG